MVYTGEISELGPNDIFVFGSNTQGRHGKGAALFARKQCGAIYGNPRGRQGQSYAIVTKDLTMDYDLPSVPKESIKSEITTLYEYALANPDLHFLIAYKGSGINLNNYPSKEIAELFYSESIPSNIVFEKEFSELVNIKGGK